MTLAIVSGCDSASNARVVSVMFLDDVIPDGIPQPGESLAITFSNPVRFEGKEHKGLELLPAGHSLGRYTISQPDPEGDRLLRHQLRVRLGEVDLALHPDGLFGDPESPGSTAITIHCGKLPNLRDLKNNTPIRATFGPIDVARRRHPPARLQRVEWRDVDQTWTVSANDNLRLTFDRAVQLAPGVKAQGSETLANVLAEMFDLPVNDDKFSDDNSTSLEEDPNDPRSILVILGNNPRLTPEGEFAANRTLRGSPSGLALKGTTIRPQRHILDQFGRGVWSSGVLDIVGQDNPFKPLPSYLHGESVLRYHTATPLPDGRVLVIGGYVEHTGSETSEVSREARIYDPQNPNPDRRWDVTRNNLTRQRFSHTATYMVGEDPDASDDDYVLVVGGWDGGKALGLWDVEVFHFATQEFVPITDVVIDTDPANPDTGQVNSDRYRRFEHTAHALPSGNKVVLIGGKNNSVLEFEHSVQTLEYTEGRLIVKQVAELHNARSLHQSLLYDSGELPPTILVWGGIGRSAPLVRGGGEVLSHPELLWNLESDSFRCEVPELADESDAAPEARWGHELLQLRLSENRNDVLLVGGNNKNRIMTTDFGPEVLTSAHRVEFQLSDVHAPQIRYLRVGQLNVGRYDFGCALLPTGKVLVVGGHDGNSAIATAELFDPESGEFQLLSGDMVVPRSGAKMVSVGEGGPWYLIGGAGAYRDGEAIVAEQIVFPE